MYISGDADHETYEGRLIRSAASPFDAIRTTYEFDREVYVWPYVRETGCSSHDDIPEHHLCAMGAFVRGFSGICNFNYKDPASGGETPLCHVR